MPASCLLTEASMALVIDGTDMALPMPTSINAPFSHQAVVTSVSCERPRNPAHCSRKPNVMMLVALTRRAMRDDTMVEMVSTAVSGIKAMPVRNGL